MKRIDETGNVYGRLTVEGLSCVQNGKVYWRCKCVCGKEVAVHGTMLRQGDTKSCGCLSRDTSSALCKSRTTHGATKSRAFNIWSRMKQRCTNENAPEYPRYGGRGITVCPEWLNSFEQFLADMEHPPTGCTLERKENDKGYYPGNCVWATRTEQNNNKRTNRLLTFGGRTQTIAQWGREVGLTGNTIGLRLRYGWTVEKALTTPSRSV